MSNITFKLLILVATFFGVIFSQLLLENYFGYRFLITFDLIILKSVWFVLGFILLFKIIIYFLRLRNQKWDWIKKQKWILWIPDRLQKGIICLWILLLMLLTRRIFWPHGWEKLTDQEVALATFTLVAAMGPALIWFLQNRKKNLRELFT